MKTRVQNPSFQDKKKRTKAAFIAYNTTPFQVEHYIWNVHNSRWVKFLINYCCTDTGKKLNCYLHSSFRTQYAQLCAILTDKNVNSSQIGTICKDYTQYKQTAFTVQCNHRWNVFSVFWEIIPQVWQRESKYAWNAYILTLEFLKTKP